MKLHEDKERFAAAVIEASRALNIHESLLEKDYFVIFLLSELNKRIPGLLFKGGTSLSHAYHAIKRFSEDLDLSLDCDHFGRNHNIAANRAIIETCDDLGLRIINRDEVKAHSHGSFNRYYIEYPKTTGFESIKPYVQIEMAFYQRAYPQETKRVNSLVGDWLMGIGALKAVEEYGLSPFEVCVQRIDRTFVDKVFALADYYIRGEYTRNSRHIYDLFYISPSIDFQDPDLVTLVQRARSERKKNPRCPSAQDDFDVGNALMEIVESGCFRRDYEDVTSKLLIQPISYEQCATVLKAVADSPLFKI